MEMCVQKMAKRKSYGKDFEAQVYADLKKLDNISVDRLKDDTLKFSGVKNPSDFIVYKKPYEIYLECKSHYGKSIPFTAISQTRDLYEKSQIDGVIAGIIVWYVDLGVTMYIPAQSLAEMRADGWKSINCSKLIDSDYEHHLMKGRRKKILFEYDMEDFLEYLWENESLS